MSPANDLPPQGKKPRKNQFKPGQSGNPAGPTPGQRHPAFAALDAIGKEGAEEALRAVNAAAAGGDMRAAEILLRRVWPERKGRVLQFKLPPVTGSADLPAALGAVVMAVGNGELTPDEATAVCAVLEAQRKAIETHDHGSRIEALEAATAISRTT